MIKWLTVHHPPRLQKYFQVNLLIGRFFICVALDWFSGDPTVTKWKVFAPLTPSPCLLQIQQQHAEGDLHGKSRLCCFTNELQWGHEFQCFAPQTIWGISFLEIILLQFSIILGCFDSFLNLFFQSKITPGITLQRFWSNLRQRRLLVT